MNIVQPIRNREDIEKMKAVLKRKKRDLVLFIFGINCGLRISDILKLNVGDVKGRDFVEIKEKKTKKNKRFPLNPELKVVLEDFVKDARKTSRYLLHNRETGLIETRLTEF